MTKRGSDTMRLCTFLIAALILTPAWGASVVIKDSQGVPLAHAMVTSTPQQTEKADLSDDGYTPDGVTNTAPAVVNPSVSTTSPSSFWELAYK